MQQVPPAKRNRSFLRSFTAWWNKEDESRAPPRRSSRLSTPGATNADTADATATFDAPCSTCECRKTLVPFEDNESVIWIPSKRSEWEDSVSELTAVCTSAAIRRLRTDPKSAVSKPFHAPLSRDYIRDRIDIDDPLNGYQLRHAHGGWLQGFVLWTNFTTWSYYFKWDSQHPVSGFASLPTTTAPPPMDISGELADELEAEPRSGDPHAGGIVFPTIAEIALLGGLGCGEYMLRMALEDIRAAKKYRYVVLQATDSSKSFYERFGFVRVGAICRYGKAGIVSHDAPLQGYRHWTHANESERSLQKHGGPSYMMCLKLPETDNLVDECPVCSEKQPVEEKPLFLKRMLELVVDEKPTIEQLGASTPLTKSASRRDSTASLPDLLPSQNTGKRGRRPSTASRPTTPTLRRKSVGAAVRSSRLSTGKKVYNHHGLKHSLSIDSSDQPPVKRRRVGSPPPLPAVATNREALLAPPEAGEPLSYAQKQYQSAWLAVRPDEPKGRRPPPKRRACMDKKLPPPPKFSKKARGSSSVKSLYTAGLPLRRESQQPEPLVLGKRPVKAIDKSTLHKQKVRAYPRSRIHYFNRVVKLKTSILLESNNKTNQQYFFVLQYDEPTGLIKIVPMSAKGRLTGKREGRPRYQAEITDTDENFRVVWAADYQVVQSAMVMKTPVVAQEAWDIEDDN